MLIIVLHKEQLNKILKKVHYSDIAATAERRRKRLDAFVSCKTHVACG